jgi:two-component system, response regulator
MTPGPRTILLVEDNPDDVELTMLALERYRLGGRLAVAPDGAEALELLIGEDATRFAFVMLDLKLPKVSRQDVLKRVRANARGRCR